MARTRSGNATTPAVRSGPNIMKFSNASRSLKPIVVSKPVGPSPAFARPFVQLKAERRTLFRIIQEAKMVRCMTTEQNRLQALMRRPMYGPRALLKERLQIRASYYPTFRPYFMRHLDALNSLSYLPKDRQAAAEYVAKVNKELDTWTFTPDRVEEGGMVE